MKTKTLALDLATAYALERKKDPRTTYDKVWRAIHRAVAQVEGSLLNNKRQPSENNLYSVRVHGTIVATFEITL